MQSLKMNKRANLLILFLAFPFFIFAQLDTIHWIPPLHSPDNAQLHKYKGIVTLAR